jgi:hypothetical protein
MMAQQIVTYCDTHLAKGEHVHGTTWTLAITVPGEKARDFELDACAECAAPFASLVADLMEHARQVGGPKTSPRTDAAPPSAVTVPMRNGTTTTTPEGRVPCPMCDKTAATRDALNTHLRNYHASSLAEVEGTATLPCPVPGCKRKLQSGTGVSAHLRSNHMEWLRAHPEHWPTGWTGEDEPLPDAASA